ncbi:hypothetical protein NQ318_008926 [Aromia moschata]|uniref:Uncharacterized protein n=1 Tax=Aromia moschata TaxID=1265417 RepID=A0AAV8ZCG2_9CUCU|nr:hypothetical protein NQ318_008926 [Aromia moschata]
MDAIISENTLPMKKCFGQKLFTDLDLKDDLQAVKHNSCPLKEFASPRKKVTSRHWLPGPIYYLFMIIERHKNNDSLIKRTRPSERIPTWKDPVEIRHLTRSEYLDTLKWETSMIVKAPVAGG